MSKPNQDDAFPAAKILHYRCTFSLPATLAKDIARLAKRMGVSQSSMLAELLTDPITAMCDIIDEIPDKGATADDVKRARGKSLSIIKDVVQQAQAAAAEVTDANNR